MAHPGPTAVFLVSYALAALGAESDHNGGPAREAGVTHDLARVQGGLLVHVGCGDGALFVAVANGCVARLGAPPH